MGVAFILNNSHICLEIQKPQLHVMYCIIVIKIFILKIRTCIEILAWNGSQVQCTY